MGFSSSKAASAFWLHRPHSAMHLCATVASSRRSVDTTIKPAPTGPRNAAAMVHPVAPGLHFQGKGPQTRVVVNNISAPSWDVHCDVWCALRTQFAVKWSSL